MILCIISHTQHYRLSDGTLVGWGATVREIDNLTKIFSQVIHVAPLHQDDIPSGMLPYTSDRVEYVPLLPSGGESVKAKLGILKAARRNISIVSEVLKRADVFQFRAPTGMGVYMIPYLIGTGKPGWFKYAGNWVQKNPPIGYWLQRTMLRLLSKHKVTINGCWPGQKPNQLTFENPCLTEAEREEGAQAVKTKNYSGTFDFIFIGRLEDAKGVRRILNVFSKLTHPRIGEIHFVGDGASRKAYEAYVRSHKMKGMVFHGFLTRDRINELLKKSHVFLLPSSASEGFPKVIAEAANYGAIPVVSDVSSIGQYIIEDKTGLIVKNADETILREKILKVLNTDESKLKDIAESAYVMAHKFTYEHYNSRIISDIIFNE